MTNSLDIILPASEELLHRAEKTLDELGIVHGDLVLRADLSQNVAITDEEYVFLKAYRRRDGLGEAKNTAIAREHGANAPVLLAETDWCTIWEFMWLEPAHVEDLPVLLPMVRAVHEGTRGRRLIEEIDYEQQLHVIYGRLTSAQDHPYTAAVEEAMERLCSYLPYATASLPLVFTHSDLQLKNMGMTPDGPLIFDWEICKTAPVELELSKLEENLFTRGEWTATRTEELYGAPLDRHVLSMATHLRYCQNLAFHIERGEHPIVEKQYAAFVRFQDLYPLPVR